MHDLEGGTLFRRNVVLGAAVALVLAFGTSFAAASANRAAKATLNGAGSTFVVPLVSKWQGAYKQATVNYSGIGSGGGIAAITARTVDFGASDAPLSRDQFASAKGVVQIPWALSATSLPYNVNGGPVGLHLSGSVVADIFLGKIKFWDNKRIKALNPHKKLPHEKVVPIYRSDASGTSFNFTDYLSHVSPDWASRVGTGTQVRFPAGVGAKGSSGVSGVLSRTSGGITYVDVEYSILHHFNYAFVKNRAGRFLQPTLVSIKAAAAGVRKIRSDNGISIVDRGKSQPKAYPISTFTWTIVPVKTKKAKDLKKFISWAITKGQSFGPKLLFVPIPKPVLLRDKQTLNKVHS